MKSDEEIEAERAAFAPLIGPTKAEWYAEACKSTLLWACRYREAARSLYFLEQRIVKLTGKNSVGDEVKP